MLTGRWGGGYNEQAFTIAPVRRRTPGSPGVELPGIESPGVERNMLVKPLAWSCLVAMLGSSAVAAAAEKTPAVQEAAVKMTYAEAKQKLMPRQLPAFWIGSIDDLAQRWSRLKVGQVRQIAAQPRGPVDRPGLFRRARAGQAGAQLQLGDRRARPGSLPRQSRASKAGGVFRRAGARA